MLIAPGGAKRNPGGECREFTVRERMVKAEMILTRTEGAVIERGLGDWGIGRRLPIALLK
jgi:hypothetical protein